MSLSVLRVPTFLGEMQAGQGRCEVAHCYNKTTFPKFHCIVFIVHLFFFLKRVKITLKEGVMAFLKV